MIIKKGRIQIRVNSPVVLSFVGICLIAEFLDMLTGGWTNLHFFSVYRSSPLDILTYVRCLGHVFGHLGWSHFSSNMIFVLLLGPMLEEKYGSLTIVFLILATALVTGLASILFFPNSMLLGASGVVFAMILLSSITGSTSSGTIPLTFLIVAVIYIGQQLYEGLFLLDNISQFAHVIGGATGSFVGFKLRKQRSDSGSTSV